MMKLLFVAFYCIVVWMNKCCDGRNAQIQNEDIRLLVYETERQASEAFRRSYLENTHEAKTKRNKMAIKNKKHHQLLKGATSILGENAKRSTKKRNDPRTFLYPRAHIEPYRTESDIPHLQSHRVGISKVKKNFIKRRQYKQKKRSEINTLELAPGGSNRATEYLNTDQNNANKERAKNGSQIGYSATSENTEEKPSNEFSISGGKANDDKNMNFENGMTSGINTTASKSGQYGASQAAEYAPGTSPKQAVSSGTGSTAGESIHNTEQQQRQGNGGSETKLSGAKLSSQSQQTSEDSSSSNFPTDGKHASDTSGDATTPYDDKGTKTGTEQVSNNQQSLGTAVSTNSKAPSGMEQISQQQNSGAAATTASDGKVPGIGKQQVQPQQNSAADLNLSLASKKQTVAAPQEMTTTIAPLVTTTDDTFELIEVYGKKKADKGKSKNPLGYGNVKDENTTKTKESGEKENGGNKKSRKNKMKKHQTHKKHHGSKHKKTKTINS